SNPSAHSHHCAMVATVVQEFNQRSISFASRSYRSSISWLPSLSRNPSPPQISQAGTTLWTHLQAHVGNLNSGGG
ncbi:hypothetical protein VIGAN_01269100, partial [Vigna angularis var. angularis]